MYQSVYAEISSETTAHVRDNERAAFEKSIVLLQSAQECGTESRQSVDALHFVNQLWCVLLEDLAAEGNSLPDELRASLISIGIWILRRVEDIRLGKSTDFAALIEVSQSILDGLGKK